MAHGPIPDKPLEVGPPETYVMTLDRLRLRHLASEMRAKGQYAAARDYERLSESGSPPTQ